MDPLLLGETLRGKTVTYRGFWMPTQGCTGVGAIQVFLISGASKFRVDAETKSSNDDDSAASNAGSLTLTGTPGSYSFDLSKGRDLIRYTLTGLDASTDQYIHFQFAHPLWQAN